MSTLPMIGDVELYLGKCVGRIHGDGKLRAPGLYVET